MHYVIYLVLGVCIMFNISFETSLIKTILSVCSVFTFIKVQFYTLRNNGWFHFVNIDQYCWLNHWILCLNINFSRISTYISWYNPNQDYQAKVVQIRLSTLKGMLHFKCENIFWSTYKNNKLANEWSNLYTCIYPNWASITYIIF